MSVIKNLSYKIGSLDLNIPEWNLSDQGVTVLTGISGSGKTTILKILCGLIACPKFSWNFKGQDLALQSPPDRKLGVCFQDWRLFPHLSARENILFAVKARGISFKDKKKDFEEMVYFLGLNASLNLHIEQLSGGEKQRVALARALIVRPRFLFLDEPFSYLDEMTKKKARKFTSEIVKKYAIPLLLISHDREDVKGLANEEFILDQGKITQNLKL